MAISLLARTQVAANGRKHLMRLHKARKARLLNCQLSRLRSDWQWAGRQNYARCCEDVRSDQPINLALDNSTHDTHPPHTTGPALPNDVTQKTYNPKDV